MVSSLEYPLTKIQAFMRTNNLAVVHISTLGRYVRKMENIERRKVEIILNLKPEEKEAGVAWAEERLNENIEWKTVIFTDEKRFN